MRNEFMNGPLKYHIAKDHIDEPIKLGNIYLVQVGLTHCTKEFAVREHLHRNWFELTRIIDGKGFVETNGCSIPVKSGDVYLSFPGDVHAINTDKEYPLKYQFLSFWPEEEATLLRFEELMMGHIDPEMRLFTDKDVEHLMDNCLSEALSEDEHSTDILICAITQIIHYILRNFSGEKRPSRKEVGSAEELCFQLMNYIGTHIYVMDSLDELAEHFGYSYSYLSALFSKTTGETLMNYYSVRRLDAAAMLLNEDMTVGAVAELLRYSSIYTFSRAFKNRFGVSPREYSKAKLI